MYPNSGSHGAGTRLFHPTSLFAISLPEAPIQDLDLTGKCNQVPLPCLRYQPQKTSTSRLFSHSSSALLLSHYFFTFHTPSNLTAHITSYLPTPITMSASLSASGDNSHPRPYEPFSAEDAHEPSKPEPLAKEAPKPYEAIEPGNFFNPLAAESGSETESEGTKTPASQVDNSSSTHDQSNGNGVVSSHFQTTTTTTSKA